MTAKKVAAKTEAVAATTRGLITDEQVYAAMPRVVKVGCYDFTIEVMDEIEGNASDAFGYCYPGKQTIRLLSGLKRQKLANVFLHEVLHGIHWFHGLGDENNEEDFTLLGANGMCAFFQDNPDAAAWFMAANKGAR
jgi:hypothetical protein